MNFETYYKNKFRLDLHQFVSTIPKESLYHFGMPDPHTVTIQYNRLAYNEHHLQFLSDSGRTKFGVALFFTILVDQVMYTYYRHRYSEFRLLTLYPKFIGNCLIACHYHFHPADIIRAMSFGIPRGKRLGFQEELLAALPVMKKEIMEFFNRYPSLGRCEDVWALCEKEIPIARVV